VDRHYRHGHRHGYRHFAIPRSIHHHRLEHYRPYYWGRSYFRDHRHYHRVYRFPVYTDYGVSYRYYPYCEGNLYDDGLRGRIGFYGDRFSIDIGF
jgi:hypothetical protein